MKTNPFIEFDSSGSVESRIWGYLLHDEQAGMMTLLEFLCILTDPKMTFPAGEEAERFTPASTRLSDYAMPKGSLLRCLVFNNPFVNEDYSGHADAWTEWHRRFNADRQNQTVITGTTSEDGTDCPPLSEEAFERLRRMFGGGPGLGSRGFPEFRKIISLLRASAINLDSNKRWTSLFLFPWGRHCLFGDLRAKSGNVDRLFFRRNGELLWLMLAHSRDRLRLEALVREKILEAENPFERFCRAITSLSPNPQEAYTVPGRTRLPLDEEHAVNLVEPARRRMNILCEDLVRVFELPIPAPDIVRHASRVVSLNLLCYFIEQGLEAVRQFRGEAEARSAADSALRQTLASAGDDEDEGDAGTEEAPDAGERTAGDGNGRCTFFCEMLQKTRSDVRRCSQQYFRANENLSFVAVEYLYAARVRTAVPSEEEVPGSDGTVRETTSLPLAEIKKRHASHWGKLHRAFAKDCGLASKLCARDYRYVPSDDLLETLAAILISGKRVPLREFLSSAFERYGLVIGPDEYARIQSGDAAGGLDHAELEGNRKRLERRLNALGLFDWLSDGCEFVRNPFRA